LEKPVDWLDLLTLIGAVAVAIAACHHPLDGRKNRNRHEKD
jgi:hypothetical protein